MAGCNMRKMGGDFNAAWGGGKWMDDRLYVDMTTQNMSMPEFNKRWGSDNWMQQSGLGQLSNEINASMKEFNQAWGGGAWMDDRLGMAQFSERGSGGGETDEPTMPDDPGDGSDVTDDTMNDLTEGDPEEEARIAQQRAMRRRALMNKMGKRSTIRTGGRGAKGY